MVVIKGITEKPAMVLKVVNSKLPFELPSIGEEVRDGVSKEKQEKRN